MAFQSHLNTAEVYDTGINGSSWEKITPMGEHRYGVGVVALSNTIYAVGGSDDQSHLLNSAEVYAPNHQGHWNSTIAPPMKQKRYKFAVCVQ